MYWALALCHGLAWGIGGHNLSLKEPLLQGKSPGCVVCVCVSGENTLLYSFPSLP